MGRPDDKNSLRLIPPVDEILGLSEISALRLDYPRFPWTRAVRGVVGELRAGKLGPIEKDREGISGQIVRRIAGMVGDFKNAGMRRVINGTGVILNTNLGRAIACAEVSRAVTDALEHYVNLEIDLESGKRSHRGEMLVELFRLLTGAEEAMVVNNNAAAVYLVVNSVSPPGRVIVSRGELVEIGGSFRLPDILDNAAGTVIEVGTTNRTYAEDYAKVAKPGDMILKVHPSNYDIKGFTHAPAISELVRVGEEKKCHVVYDVGSGCFFDFAARGLEGEQLVEEILQTGVDCVTMSGDKLLGGVQAGVIVGRRKFLDIVRGNPMRRALRIDKVTIAALQALVRTYLFDKHPEKIVPILAQSTGDIEAYRKRAGRIAERLSPAHDGDFKIEIVDDLATIGGGSFACQDVPSAAVCIRCTSEQAAVALAKKMRTKEIPILSRIKGVEVRINLRSVLPYEDDDLCAGLDVALSNPSDR